MQAMHMLPCVPVGEVLLQLLITSAKKKGPLDEVPFYLRAGAAMSTHGSSGSLETTE